MKFLVVDDEPTTRKSLTMYLQKIGYDSQAACDGFEAWTILDKETFDIVICDINMPGINGIDLLKKITLTFPSLSTIMLTGCANVDNASEAVNYGADGFLCKPLDVDKLNEIISKIQISKRETSNQSKQRLQKIRETQSVIFTPPETYPDANFAAHYSFPNGAGGDFYDVFPLQEKEYGYFLGDVSGHNLETGFLAPTLKGIAKEHCGKNVSLKESMKKMNNSLINIFPEERFITACYLQLNRKSMRLSIVNAAHPEAIFVPLKGDPCFLHSKGDRLYLYTDGLYEWMLDKEISTKCKEALLDTCKKVKNLPIQDSVTKIPS